MPKRKGEKVILSVDDLISESKDWPTCQWCGKHLKPEVVEVVGKDGGEPVEGSDAFDAFDYYVTKKFIAVYKVNRILSVVENVGSVCPKLWKAWTGKYVGRGRKGEVPYFCSMRCAEQLAVRCMHQIRDVRSKLRIHEED